MGLLVSTTGFDITLSELGVTLAHPVVDLDLEEQFSPEELRDCNSLTNAIISGLLTWRTSLVTSIRPANTYDADIVLAQSLGSGTSTEFVGSGTPISTPVDFAFDGSFSVKQNGGFSVGTRSAKAKAGYDIQMETIGSISLGSGGSISVGPNANIRIRSA